MDSVDFHGYKILKDGNILSKKGEVLSQQLRPRKGGGFDKVVLLYVGKKQVKFTVSRLILASFDGCMYGYEANHRDRNPMNNNYENLERQTPSENQLHWRRTEK